MSYKFYPNDILKNLLKFCHVNVNLLNHHVPTAQERIMQNNKTIERDVAHRLSLAESRTDDLSARNSGSGNMLSLRMKNPLCIIPGLGQGSSDQDSDKTIHVTAKLPAVEKIPHFTTWVFSTRYSLTSFFPYYRSLVKCGFNEVFGIAYLNVDMRVSSFFDR